MSNMTDISFTCPHCYQQLDAPHERAGTQLACPTCNMQIMIPVVITAPRSSLASRLAAGLLGGLFVSIYAVNIFSMAAGDMFAKKQSEPVEAIGFIIFVIIWAAVAILALKAHRAAIVWRRILIACGCLSFSLPLAGFVMAANMATKLQAHPFSPQAFMFGDSLPAFLAFLGITGFFLGAIFLTVGLLIGRNAKPRE